MRIFCCLMSSVLFASLLGCGENASFQTFELPPRESMSLDLSLFGGVLLAPTLSQEMTHFAAASAYVARGNLAIAIPIAVPLRILKDARSALPTRVEPNLQFWEYVSEIDGSIYQAHLEGIAGETEVDWTFTVSSAALDLTDFVWIRGTSSLSQQEGSWLIEFGPNAPASVLLEWQHPRANEVMLRFERRGQPAASEIASLIYQSIPALQGSAIVLTLEETGGASAEIGWDTATSAGYLLSPGDRQGQKSCWDADRQDTTCTP